MPLNLLFCIYLLLGGLKQPMKVACPLGKLHNHLYRSIGMVCYVIPHFVPSIPPYRLDISGAHLT